MFMNVGMFFGVVFAGVLLAQLVMAGIAALVMTTDAYIRYTIKVSKNFEKEMIKNLEEEGP